jgi:hypothetical protein
MRKTIYETTRPALSTTGRHANANESRPAQSPSAEAARTTLDADSDKASSADTPGKDKDQAGDRTSARSPLPTIEELERARDDHSRKIAGREADASGRLRAARGGSLPK